MKINKLIKTNYNIEINSLKTNSKEISKGDVFICTLGLIDKTKYIEDAIKRGCSLVITNKKINNNIPCIVIKNIDLKLKTILDKYYNYPLSKLNLIGVTGTDGKTTITSILKDMTNSSSIGTNGLVINSKRFELNNTTPSLDKIYECFEKILNYKKKNVFIEVSSEAYLTKRIPNLFFDIGVFTNITKEHLDKHKNFNNYLKCKMQLLKNSFYVVLNRDDKYFNKLKKVNSNYKTYGFKNSDITIKKYRLYIDHTYICFKYQNKYYDVISPLIGKYNVYNLVACILVLILLNYEMDDIIERIKLIKTIPGRNEILYNKEYLVMIDHAHTINAIQNILNFVYKVKKGRVIVVLGCAGGRYKEKRQEIGRIVLKKADIAIFTMDDPREEKVSDIIDDILAGNDLKNKEYYEIIDREKAIKKALYLAKKDDIVLILGRGRDKIMHIKNNDFIFNDYDITKKILYKNSK